MSAKISNLSDIHPSARLGSDVEVGPFCSVGPDVILGDACRLDSHVAIVGKTTIGSGNRFFPNCVIGGEPQDVSYRETDTELIIGNDNQFREGVTISRGAEKEDGTTQIGNNNLLMANSHVAHNCRVYNNVTLVNGVLLGGHVHVHDRAIISGNSAVHHFCTVGRLAFVSGVGRVMRDVPPFMLAAGNEHQRIITINHVGMRRANMSESTIAIIKQAFRLLYRKNLRLADVRQQLEEQLDGVFPFALTTLLKSVELQQRGRVGRAREAFRDQPASATHSEHPIEQRRAA